jgi:hypothetical protein
LERKECFHHCMIVLSENLGCASHSHHFQMHLGIDRAEEVLQCSAAVNLTWSLMVAKNGTWLTKNKSPQRVRCLLADKIGGGCHLAKNN